MGAKSSWFEEGREIGIVYTSESAGEPKLILDSETKQAWWIPVEPTRRETSGDRSVIWYDYATILAAMKENGVTDPTDLRNFMVVATELGVTTYEIVVTGDAKITYMVNGRRYKMGSEYPADPVLDDWVFLGWYQSKTYEKEYTKDTVLGGDTVVYAMLRLKTDEERAAELTPTAAPTEAAVPTAAPEEAIPTEVPAESRDDHGPSSIGWQIICLIGLAAVAVIVVAVMHFTKKKQ